MNYLKKLILAFRDRRNWGRFHNGERLSAKLVIEAAEIAELFEWGKEPEYGDLCDELADVFIIMTYLADEYGVDIEQAVYDKLKENEKRFPIDKQYNEWRETK